MSRSALVSSRMSESARACTAAVVPALHAEHLKFDIRDRLLELPLILQDNIQTKVLSAMAHAF